MSSGAFALGHSASYYYTGRDLAHAFFAAVPFGLTAQQHDAWIIAGGGQELWDEINARDNLIAFAAGNTGTQMGGWFRREINTPEDLRGLTMRIPGFGGEVMSRAGVNVQNLPGGEIFLALDTGVIDATEWVGPLRRRDFGSEPSGAVLLQPRLARTGRDALRVRQPGHL